MARMGGIVETIQVDRGARVKQGDPLLFLRNQDLKLFLERAEIEARQRRIDLQRVTTLFKEKTVSASQFEAADLALKMAEVEVEIAREELEKSYVRAPFDGVVAERYARLGQKVIEDDNVPLFRVTALAPLQARLYLSEDVARSLHKGDTVMIVPRYRPSASVTGTVAWVSGIVDASSGTSQAIVSVPSGNGAERLSPGMSVTVQLSLPAASAAVLVPRAALDGDPYAPGTREGRVKVIEDGLASWRTVQVGALRGDRVEILDGLRPGETVALLSGEEAGRPDDR
jgi:membrane fusion protein (multidrug efflux system)